MRSPCLHNRAVCDQSVRESFKKKPKYFYLWANLLQSFTFDAGIHKVQTPSFPRTFETNCQEFVSILWYFELLGCKSMGDTQEDEIRPEILEDMQKGKESSEPITLTEVSHSIGRLAAIMERMYDKMEVESSCPTGHNHRHRRETHDTASEG